MLQCKILNLTFFSDTFIPVSKIFIEDVGSPKILDRSEKFDMNNIYIIFYLWQNSVGKL